jgi:ATP-dependent helicase/nuclease subunit B
LRDKGGVQARFLVGPAGSGKTFLCLEEIRCALLADPSGPPLLLLAPKQATFQLERQILADPALSGYTRLRIVSFERLAQFVLDQLHQPLPPLLSDDGRAMVLHALLARRRDELQIFHASAALAGFARQLSLELRELQHRQLSPEKLRALAQQPDLADSLRRKLLDLALLLDDYLAWLRQHQLQDADCLLDLATAALQRSPNAPIASHLWLDGFAELTPQELDLLAALAPRCQNMTLAFCLDGVPPETDPFWLSIWTCVARTFRQCRARLSALPGARLTMEVLPRPRSPGRFTDNPVLRHLEEKWTAPSGFSERGAVKVNDSLRAAVCANPAAEAVLAAREIVRFARAGGRYRDAAVLLRDMEGYHDALRRVFSRYEIPFFLDRRELVGQHPLAELTRSVLRAAAFDWRHEDWFGALKTGLVTADEESVDRLENEALARGWRGQTWFAPLSPDRENSDWPERWRAKWIPPFATFRKSLLPSRPSGPQLARALRQLWRDLDVQKTLEHWSAAEPRNATHATVWRQMNLWLDDLALAFADESMPLRDWLPILEAGVAGLTVGVIPPALDQVLIGTIDRSRNPDLKLVLLLGVNETVFPAAPAAGNLLNESDRAELGRCDISLGHTRRQFLSRERFFGYIACTRSRRRLVVACSERGAGDQPLNPSPFFSHLRNLFPQLTVKKFPGADWQRAEYPCELAGQWARAGEGAPILRQVLARPAFDSLRELMAGAADAVPERLSPEIATRLYGPALRTSVSRLEEFAACSFKFFVHSGLRAEERERFELDVRERGSFQHAVLALFHQQLRRQNMNWRDLTPAEARRRVQQSVAELLPQFRQGLLAASAQSRFSARTVAGSLQEFVAATVQWMDHYKFDPCEVELGFGTGDRKLPAWELDLGSGRRLVFRGIIDRIDLCRVGPQEDQALAVVIDYKSGARSLDKILMANGLQLQLAAYLGVLRHLADARETFGVGRLTPAGVFYVNLRGQSERGDTRAQVLARREDFLQKRFQHSGRFDSSALPFLDARSEREGTQFKFRLNADGRPDARNTDLLPSDDFRQLLDQTEAQLVRMGREIYDGAIQINPYQKGRERACDKCFYKGICRFDPWIHSYRVLASSS